MIKASFGGPRFWVGLALASSLLAGEPDRAPARQVVYSTNGKFYGVSDPKEGNIVVYSIKHSMQEKTKVWVFEKNVPNFHLSEDGLILAEMPDEWNRVKLGSLAPEALRAAVVLDFHHRDGQSKKITLGQLVKDPKKLKATDFNGFYNWGHILGFDENNRLVVDTFERHRLLIDPQSGQVLSDEDHNEKEWKSRSTAKIKEPLPEESGPDKTTNRVHKTLKPN